MSFQRYSPDQLRQIGTEQSPHFVLDFPIMSGAPPIVAVPRARRSREPVHRTPNLLENTSLDENFNALPPMPPQPRVILHRREREMLQQQMQQRREEEHEYRQFLRDQQRDVHCAKKVDRRAERLYKHREQELNLTTALTEALQKWQKDSPSSHEKFRTHCVHAGVVSETPVRFTDIALWYAEDIPKNVRSSLEAKSKYLHIDAWLERDLNAAEHDESWRPDDSGPILNAEIHHAARQTKITKSQGQLQYVKHIGFGFESDLQSIYQFRSKFSNSGEELKRYYFVQASFRVRKVLFDITPWQSRYDGSFLPSWCVIAMRTLKAMTMGPSGETCSLELKQRCEKLCQEMNELLTHIQDSRAEVIAAVARIKKVLKPKCLEYHKDRDITPARKAVLEQEFQEMKEYLEEIEERIGQLSLPEWRCFLPESCNEERWDIV